MRWLEATDARLTWHNVAELYRVPAGFRVQRVSEEWRAEFPDDVAWRALQSANVFLRFRSDAQNVAIRWHNLDDPPPPEEEHWGEVFCNGNPVGRFGINRQQELEFTSESGGLWEVHFAWAASVIFQGLGISDGHEIEPEAVENQRRWLVYGDSITQGFRATHATRTWPWLAAQRMGVEPINMGFGGAARGEEIVAHCIGERTDWDMLTLAFGINNVGTHNAAQVEAIYERFLTVIRETQPTKPIQCITPILTEPRDVNGELIPSGERVQDLRDAIAEVVQRRMASDENLYLVDGLSCVESLEGLADTVHPNDQGMRSYAQRIAEAWGEEGRRTKDE